MTLHRALFGSKHLRKLSSHRMTGMTHRFDYLAGRFIDIEGGKVPPGERESETESGKLDVPYNFSPLAEKCSRKGQKKNLFQSMSGFFAFSDFSVHTNTYDRGKMFRRWLFFFSVGAGIFPTIYNWRLEGKLFTLNFLKDFLKMTSRLIFQISIFRLSPILMGV